MSLVHSLVIDVHATQRLTAGAEFKAPLRITPSIAPVICHRCNLLYTVSQKKNKQNYFC